MNGLYGRVFDLYTYTQEKCCHVILSFQTTGVLFCDVSSKLRIGGKNGQGRNLSVQPSMHPCIHPPVPPSPSFQLCRQPSPTQGEEPPEEASGDEETGLAFGLTMPLTIEIAEVISRRLC